MALCQEERLAWAFGPRPHPPSPRPCRDERNHDGARPRIVAASLVTQSMGQSAVLSQVRATTLGYTLDFVHFGRTGQTGGQFFIDGQTAYATVVLLGEHLRANLPALMPVSVSRVSGHFG